jgi:hypothetical protein
LPKRNSLSFFKGPPREALNWFRRKGGTTFYSKKFRVSRALLPRSSNKDPCSELVPIL